MQDGYNIACKYGLSAMDALHIAAAISVGAEEFIITEKPTKPMYRVTGLKVVSLSLIQNTRRQVRFENS